MFCRGLRANWRAPFWPAASELKVCLPSLFVFCIISFSSEESRTGCTITQKRYAAERASLSPDKTEWPTADLSNDLRSEGDRCVVFHGIMGARRYWETPVFEEIISTWTIGSRCRSSFCTSTIRSFMSASKDLLDSTHCFCESEAGVREVWQRTCSCAMNWRKAKDEAGSEGFLIWGRWRLPAHMKGRKRSDNSETWTLM